MGDQFYRSGRSSGFQYDNKKDSDIVKYGSKENDQKKNDEDLIIEENTIYEIDRECYERFKRQRRK